MDFLQKAKAGLKELEGDFNKATASLGLGEKKEDTTSNSTAQSTPWASNLLLLAPLLMPQDKAAIGDPKAGYVERALLRQTMRIKSRVLITSRNSSR